PRVARASELEERLPVRVVERASLARARADRRDDAEDGAPPLLEDALALPARRLVALRRELARGLLALRREGRQGARGDEPEGRERGREASVPSHGAHGARDGRRTAREDRLPADHRARSSASAAALPKRRAGSFSMARSATVSTSRRPGGTILRR